MKLTWPRAVAILLLLALAGGVYGLSGLFPLAASEGHWGVTEALLKFGMRRVVATQSRSTPKEAPGGLSMLEAAGHYETACRFCHGAPGDPSPAVPGDMLPPPPDLQVTVADWKDRELFWIVKHGIKFTGMPGWQSQKRDDEVWSMVAFLRQLPTLDPEGYERLVFGGKGEEALGGCSRCHGANGRGRDDGIPKLAGQSEAYLLGSLQAYADGRRHSGIMQAVARGLDPVAMQRIARRYGRLEPGPPEVAPADAVARGRRIAEEGVPSRRVGACVECHGPAEPERNPNYPRLAGQYAAYLEEQLELLQRDLRGGTPWIELMDTALGHRLEPAQIRDVAAWYASLPPAPGPRLPEAPPPSSAPPP